MSYKHVLLATDTGLELNERSIAKCAHDVAMRSGAKLSHIHAVQQLGGSGMGSALASVCEFEEAMSTTASLLVEETDDNLGIAQTERTINHGRPADIFNNHAKAVAADLVVTQTHPNMFNGAISREDKALLKNANCDILFVRNQPMAYKKMLLAVDLETPLADKYIEQAAKFAKDNQATLSVVYVIAQYPFANIEFLSQKLIAEREEEFLTSAWLKLQNLADKHALNQDNMFLRIGNLKAILQHEIEEQEFDLLMLGNTWHHGIKAFSASTASKLIQMSPCDVLALHLPQS